MSDEVLALVTCPQEASDQIAEELINSQLVACVNIIPQIKSVYKWEGKLAKEQEALLIIKTNLRVWSQLESKIRSVHS
ncbi:MAG: divalent-cation tolerance protein CutA, partial [Leptolyngbya sp.]|nr:divalent-cation tolerance protein CutA [Candidatus Melainabacteria bacterium]